MFSLTGLPSSWEQPDCSLWDNQPASQTPRPREAASPMIEGAHRDYAAVDDSANKVPDGVLGIIGNYLNPFNSELATARLSTFLREKTGADVLGNRPLESHMHAQLALDLDYGHPSLSSFKEGAKNVDGVIQNLKSRAQLIGISQQEINESGMVDLANKILDLEDLNFLFFSRSFLNPNNPLIPQLLVDMDQTDVGRALLVEINRYNEGNLDQEAQIALAKQYAIFAKNWLTDPANAVYIQNVTNLNCFGCDLKILPPEIRFFKGLQRLDLSDNRLTNIDALHTLVGLLELDLSNNQLTDVNGLGTLVELQDLRIRNNQLTNVDTLHTLVGLLELDLSHNQLTNVDTLHTLVGLLELDLSHNQLANVDALHTLVGLWVLRLKNNRLSIFDKVKDSLVGEIGRWQKLEEAGFPLWEKPFAHGAQLIEDTANELSEFFQSPTIRNNLWFRLQAATTMPIAEVIEENTAAAARYFFG